MPLTLGSGSSQLFQGPFMNSDRSQKCPCSVLKRLGTLAHMPKLPTTLLLILRCTTTCMCRRVPSVVENTFQNGKGSHGIRAPCEHCSCIDSTYPPPGRLSQNSETLGLLQEGQKPGTTEDKPVLDTAVHS